MHRFWNEEAGLGLSEYSIMPALVVVALLVVHFTLLMESPLPLNVLRLRLKAVRTHRLQTVHHPGKVRVGKASAVPARRAPKTPGPPESPGPKR